MRGKEVKRQREAGAQRHAADQGENRVVGLKLSHDHLLPVCFTPSLRADSRFHLLSLLFVIYSNSKVKSPK
jgi:hypothetical protein